MNRIEVGEGCCARTLTELIAAHLEDTEFYFPAGQYYLSEAVTVRGARNIVLRGDGAVLVTHFSPCGEPSENNNGFTFVDCENVVIADFTCTTDAPTSNAGRVIAKDEENGTYDVQIDAQFPMTGWEHLWGCNTCDEEGTPDYVLASYDQIVRETVTDENGVERVRITGVPYTLIGENVIRVHLAPGTDMSRLTMGHRVLYRYVIYGNSLFTFHGCHNVVLRNIEIERCTSMGAVVYPRSSNFTFENFNIRSPENSHALYAANADGIHILGLCGYLHMKDCTFVGLGDDALNIHGQAGEIEEIDLVNQTMTCIYRHRDMTRGALNGDWARAGDVINVYDRETFLKKGTITLSDYENGTAAIASYTGTFSTGDILANDAYFASVHLENCEVRHTRARGFLLQSRNILVENCRIYGMSLPGIIVSPDIRVWYEVGPSDNVEIRGCTFEKCAFTRSAANLGAIVVKACHDAGADNYPAGVHTNIRILGNTFKHCGNSGIFISATDGVRIAENTFSHCSSCRYDETAESTLYDIVTKNCTQVQVEENHTDKAEVWLCRIYGDDEK